LLVGENGRMIRIRRFKGLVIFLLVLTISATGAAVGMYYFAQGPLLENRRLNSDLKSARKSLQILKESKEHLLAQLVVAEQRLEELSRPPKRADEPQPVEPETGEVLKSEKNNPSSPGEDHPPEPSPTPAETPDRAVTEAAEAIEPVGEPPTENASQTVPREVSPAESVFTIEEFGLKSSGSAGGFRIRFKLVNISKPPRTISGRLFVVLEPAEVDGGPFLTIPKVDLVSGRPLSHTGGRYFSISRFNTIRFKVRDGLKKQDFKQAAVFVYDTEGELLLKRIFPLANQAETGR
jgi:hypothetical protein